eukprot:m.44283 g.44283  ORF g.44283 m.44283 type:complete len:195 (-) comp6502_c0_seq1:58-642(-)
MDELCFVLCPCLQQSSSMNVHLEVWCVYVCVCLFVCAWLCWHVWARHPHSSSHVSLHGPSYVQERTLASSAALQPARTFLVANATGSVPTGALVNKLGGPRRAAVRVDSKCRLAEMTTCWRKGPEDAVAEQIDCPTALLTSSRNNAMQLGCVRVLLGEAGACSAVSDQLLKVLKGKRPAVPPHQHGPAPPPSSS